MGLVCDIEAFNHVDNCFLCKENYPVIYWQLSDFLWLCEECAENCLFKLSNDLKEYKNLKENNLLEKRRFKDKKDIRKLFY